MFGIWKMITEWEKVFATYNIDKEFESGIYKGLLKNKQPTPKEKRAKLTKTLYKKGTLSGNKGMKRCSTSVKNANYDSSAKLLRTFPFIPRNDKSLKIWQYQVWWRHGAPETLVHCWRSGSGLTTLETVWHYLFRLLRTSTPLSVSQRD